MQNHSRVNAAFTALLRRERLSAIPVAPWESIDGDPNDTLGGLRADAPAGLISHRSFLLLFDSGNDNEQLACPISVRYLRPGERVWRHAPPPLLQAPSSGCGANANGFPRWWAQHLVTCNLGTCTRTPSVRLQAPSALWDPLGRLPDHRGEQSRHLALYYHIEGMNASSCIGRLTARWLGVSSDCEPELSWEDDGAPVLCTTETTSVETASATLTPPLEARHPHVVRGLDGDGLYLYIGGAVAVHALAMNASDGRLPLHAAAAPAETAQLVAVGPSFHLHADRPLDDLDGVAAISSEDGSHLLLPGLQRSPRSKLAGARLLARDSEWALAERADLGFHIELELPPGFVSDDNEIRAGESDETTAAFAEAQTAFTRKQREAFFWGERADCQTWCRGGVHCVVQLATGGDANSTRQRALDDLSSNRTGTLREECRGCPECLRLERRGALRRQQTSAATPSELRQRLAGYATMGGTATRAATQSLAPCVFAVSGYYYLLVQWFAPHATSRIMYGRSRSPLGPFVDRDGRRMNETRNEKLAASAYHLEPGVRYQGDDLNVSDWLPAGGEAHTHVDMSVRCGPAEILGQTRHSTGELAEAAVSALGERFVNPLVGEPLCATRSSGVLTTSTHALRDVNSAAECQRYCAATAPCRFFSYVGFEAQAQPWRDMGGTCTLKATRSASNGSEFDQAFVWGAKPTPINVEVPGGSLLLDAPAVSLRGEAQGPASAGGLAFVMLPGQDGFERNEPAEPQVRLVVSFTFAPTRRCAAYYDRLERDELPGGFEEGVCETNHSTSNASSSNASSANESMAHLSAHLGLRELRFTSHGWLELSSRGAAANASFPQNPRAQRERIHVSRYPPESNADSYGRGANTLDVVGNIGCQHPLLRAFRRSPACARAYVSSPTNWDPNAAHLPDVHPTHAAAEVIPRSQAVASTVAQRMWPLHLAPLPPACVDDQSTGAAARSSQLGYDPPLASCIAAAAVGLCADAEMRLRCPLACNACPRASFSISCGCEPAIGGSNTSSIETSATIEAARSLLTPLWTCDVAPIMHVSRIDPTALPLAGGAPITVHGSGFTAPASCRFGEQEQSIAAENVSAHRLVCLAPPVADMVDMYRVSNSRVLSVHVASALDFDGRWPSPSWSFTSAESTLFAFNATRLLAVEWLQPGGGPVSGGTLLAVHGDLLLRPPDRASRTHLNCHFTPLHEDGRQTDASNQTTISVASVMSGGSVRCRTPASSHAGLVRVGLRYAHVTNDAPTATFAYFEIATVHASDPHGAERSSLALEAAYPRGGPSQGGTVVTLRGSGLFNHGGQDRRGLVLQGMYCRFDPPAANESSIAAARSHLAALAEAHARLELLKLEAFEMRASMAASIEPGPSLFSLDRAARIEGELASARQTAIVAQADVDALQLYGFDTSSGRMRVATSLVPAHVVPNSNGTMVTCTSPELPDQLSHSLQQASIYLTTNADASALSETSVSFFYYPERSVRLRAMTPTGGPTDGNTTVLVHAIMPRNMPLLADSDGQEGWEGDLTPVSCRFASVIVPGVHVVTEEEPGTTPSGRSRALSVRCVSPAVPGLAALQNASTEAGVTILLNGQDAATGPKLRWLFYPAHRVLITALAPRGGPSAGGTLVRVFGSLFRNAGGVQCRFGGEAGTTVPATWRAMDQIDCMSPPLARSVSGVDTFDTATGPWSPHAVCITLNGDLVACNGAAATEEHVARFWHFDAALAGNVTSIYPSAGPAAGGTEITITGSHFRDLGSGRADGPQCVFGEPAITGIRTSLTPAVPLLVERNSTSRREEPPAVAQFRCLSPPRSAVVVSALVESENKQEALPVSVAVRLTMNADPTAASSTAARFAYFDV